MSSDTARPAGKGLSKAFVWFHATSANGGAMAILPALTLDERERNDVLSKGAGVCALMYTIASTLTPQLVALVGSYRNLMLICAVFSAVCFWGLYKTSEERYVDAKKERDGLKQLILVFRHREIWPLMLCWCLASISYGFMFTSSVYYAQYILAGDRIDLAVMGEAATGFLCIDGGILRDPVLYRPDELLVLLYPVLPCRCRGLHGQRAGECAGQ